MNDPVKAFQNALKRANQGFNVREYTAGAQAGLANLSDHIATSLGSLHYSLSGRGSMDDQGVYRWSEEDRRKASEVEKELQQLKQTVGKLASDLLRLERQS
jgi:ABC-type phosphonate transport system ATPase subunit